MRRNLALTTVALAVVLAPVLTGATAVGAASQQTDPAAASAVFLPDDSVPVPVPEPTEKAIRFYLSGNVLCCIRTVWELAVPALILFTGFSARLRHWAERTGRSWLFTLAIYLVVFMATKYLLEFPLSC